MPFLKINYSNKIEVTLGNTWDYKIPSSTIRQLELIPKNKEIILKLDDDFDLDFCGGKILHSWCNNRIFAQNELLYNQKSKHILKELDSSQKPKDKSLQEEIIVAHKDSFKIIKNFSKKLYFAFGFLGEIISLVLLSFIKTKNIRVKAFFYHTQESLIKAVGIVSLACFLIGIVIAYQGSIQLKQFGASILIVEMSAMLTLREMSPIIAAIIIAGRSASSFSAEIGMMKSTQELDAMSVMGFNPITFLVIPRILALCLIMPLVVFIADLFGILGSMFISSLQLDISTEQFLERFLTMVDERHFWVGMIKAPFFGLIISIIGCYHGFIVAKDTRSIGLHTTKSVVESIFAVIAFDAICSVIFTKLGL